MEKITSKQMLIMDVLRKIEKGRATEICKETGLPWSSLDREINQLCQKGYIKGVERTKQSIIYGINTSKEFICGINITNEKVVIVIADLYFEIKEVISIDSNENVYQSIDNAINKALEYIDGKTTKFSNIFITTAEDLDIIEDFLSWDMKDRLKEIGVTAHIINPIEALLSVTETRKNIKSIAYINSKGIRCATQIGKEKLISKKYNLNNTHFTISNFKDDIDIILDLFHNYLLLIGNDGLYVYSSEKISSDVLTRMFYETISVNMLCGTSYSIRHKMGEDTSDTLALGAAVCGYYNTAVENTKK